MSTMRVEQREVEQVSLLSKHDDGSRDEDDLLDEMERLDTETAPGGVRQRPNSLGHKRRKCVRLN